MITFSHYYFSNYFLAECQEGHYGYNCEEKCSENCGDSGKCDRKTGQCKDGCKAGWIGNTCEKGERFKEILSGIPDIKILLVVILKEINVSPFLKEKNQTGKIPIS